MMAEVTAVGIDIQKITQTEPPWTNSFSFNECPAACVTLHPRSHDPGSLPLPLPVQCRSKRSSRYKGCPRHAASEQVASLRPLPELSLSLTSTLRNVCTASAHLIDKSAGSAMWSASQQTNHVLAGHHQKHGGPEAGPPMNTCTAVLRRGRGHAGGLHQRPASCPDGCTWRAPVWLPPCVSRLLWAESASAGTAASTVSRLG